MSIYEDRFKNHPVHENLLSTTKRLESLLSKDNEPEAIEHLNRLLKITNYAQAVLNNLDFTFVQEVTLNHINNRLNNINGDLDNYESTHEMIQLIAANGRADNILNDLQQIPKKWSNS